MKSGSSGVGRRRFLTGSLLGTAAVSLAQVPGAQAAKPDPAPDPKKILNYQPGMKYRRMGNTDIYLSAISLGGLVSVEAVIRAAIERGVNVVHTCDTYLGGQSIVTMGNVMKTNRDKVYIAVKDTFHDIDTILKTLNTDHIDFLMFNRHTEESAADPKIREQFEKYKKQGKVRFAGLTSHGGVKESTGAGIRSGMFSLVMPSLNQPALESMDAELRLAQEKGVGVMPMKTMKGLPKDNINMQAAFFKKLLGNPAVATVVKGVPSFEMFDAFMKAMNEPLTAMEDKSLYKHAQLNRAANCMMCDDCKGVCPIGVEISAMLRCKDYYYEQMGDVQTALATYKSIPIQQRGSEDCHLCAKCEGACPNGIQILERLHATRELFSQMA
jgi:predicted aldo/keto reductase-like oxidoreductase